MKLIAIKILKFSSNLKSLDASPGEHQGFFNRRIGRRKDIGQFTHVDILFALVQNQQDRLVIVDIYSDSNVGSGRFDVYRNQVGTISDPFIWEHED